MDAGSSSAGPSDPAALSLDDDEPLFGQARPPPPQQRTSTCDGQLYALLNVEQDASDADIVRSYRSLAMLLHPDKHSDPRQREAAQGRFEAVHHAYEVLSDSHKRAVYDLLGEEGLKTNWEVSKHKRKTAAELRAESQNAAWTRYTTEVESLVKSTGEVNCTIDGRALVATHINGQKPRPLDRLRYLSRRQLSIQHSFNVPLSSSTTAVFKAHMLQRPNQAGGNVVGTLRHQFSPKMNIELGSTFLVPYIVTTKATYSPDPDTFISFGSSSRSLAAPPPWSITYGQMLLPGFTAFCTFKSGIWTLGSWGCDVIGADQRSSAPPAFVIGASSSNNWNGNVEAWAGGAAISVDYKAVALGNVKLSTGLTASTLGAVNATFKGERRITTDTHLAFILALPLAGSGAMTLRIRLSRLGQRFVLPIILTQDANLTLALSLLAIPTISMTALHHLYLVPRKRRRIARKLVELREDNWELLGRQRAAAEDAVNLLRDPIARRVQAERARPDGLVIISALYGLSPSSSSLTPTPDLDVTIPVQALVQNGLLIIPGGRSKAGLLGFYDPCVGEAKRLVVRYEFQGRAHEATWDDLAAVSAPLRSHIVVD